MSFTDGVKRELCALKPKRDCCLRAECYGVWLFSRCFGLKDAAFVTESVDLARRMLELAAAGAGVSGTLSYGLSRRKRMAYRVSLPEGERERLLAAFGHTGMEPSLKVNRAALENDCCTAAFLRGAFLVCGTVTDPKKQYHLEFSIPHWNLANSLYTLLGEVPAFSVLPSLSARKSGYMVYLKEGGQIEDLLTYMGAAQSSMELMQVRMYKEAKNHINRKANFETANMDKTLSASAQQTAAIAALSDAGKLAVLSDELQELAQLRLENPEMTLRQMGKRLGLSASGVNHRMQKLLALGKKL